MSELYETSEEALIDAALAKLAPQMDGGAAMDAATEASSAPATTAEAPVWTRTPLPPASPTLGALDASRRPTASTVCEDCPNSVWFASPAALKCYCRVMFLVTWSSREPNQITHCDGAYLGTDGLGQEA